MYTEIKKLATSLVLVAIPAAIGLTACSSGTAQPVATVTVTAEPTAQIVPPMPEIVDSMGLAPSHGDLMTTFGEGVYTVGLDIKPGTYRVTEPVTGADCYWSITKTGSNGSNIIQNAIVEGGYPTVTLKRGQDFESVRCGSWKIR